MTQWVCAFLREDVDRKLFPSRLCLIQFCHFPSECSLCVRKAELCSGGMRRCRIAAIAAAGEGKGGGGGGKDGVKIEELHSAMH